MRKIIFGAGGKEVEEFKRSAAFAKESGATHIYVSNLPKSRWQWDMDRTDPYPNWGMMHSSIFKVATPEVLTKWIPRDYSERCLEIFAQYCEIARSFGLKGAFQGCEPGWLPEDVFIAHPEWRGPRCDHTRRSTKPYYAVCIDNPEILSMYEESVKKLCEIGEIELFVFLTNDSGGGICWSKGLYPGANGPSACRNVTFSDRVIGFLSAIQRGAEAAGVSAEVELNGTIPPEEIDSVMPNLKPGQSVVNLGNIPARPRGCFNTFHIGFKNDFFGDDVYPVKGIPHLQYYIETAKEALEHPENNLSVYVQSYSMDVIQKLVKRLLADPPKTSVERAQLLASLATDEAGDSAEALVDVWKCIYDYRANISPIHLGGNMTLLGTVNQRWLIRPLVLRPLELPEEVTAMYRPYQFQANGDEAAADLMDLQGVRMISGYSGTLLTGLMIQNAIDLLSRADKLLASITEQMTSKKSNEYALLRRRLNALSCIMTNARNSIRFQELLDRVDLDEEKEEPPRYPTIADQRLLEAQDIVRDEIDNTYRLIRILDSDPENILYLASTEEEEDIFTLSPNIVAQLHKKAEVMLEHMHDFDTFFRRPLY